MHLRKCKPRFSFGALFNVPQRYSDDVQILIGRIFHHMAANFYVRKIDIYSP